MSGGDFRQSSALQMYLRVRTNRLKANVIEPAIQNHICPLFFSNITKFLSFRLSNFVQMAYVPMYGKQYKQIA